MSEARGFLVDVGQCTGCNACELACAIENELAWGTSWRQVVTYNEPLKPEAPVFHLSVACNHCDEAPCQHHCPALAISRDESTDTVQIDPTRCIGCRYCAWACPYEAPRFDAQAGVMTKCTACHHRLTDQKKPACVEACPTTALDFDDLDRHDPGWTSDVPGFPKTAAEPRIRFRPARSPAPETTWQLPADVMDSFAAARPAQSIISLRHEWPAWLFSAATTAAVTWFISTLAGGSTPPTWGLLSLAVLGLGVSTAHLGIPVRGWRAILNVRRSWLSREIGAVSGFFGAAVLYAWGGLGSGALGVTIAGLGLLALFCIDRVYDLVRSPRGLRIHSADTLLTAALASCLIRGWLGAFALVGGLKLVLYATQARREGSHSRITWLRFVLPGILVVVGPLASVALGAPVVGPMVSLIAGELLDRASFYRDLEATRLQTHADRALERSMAA